jgi:hypothetical protein
MKRFLPPAGGDLGRAPQAVNQFLLSEASSLWRMHKAGFYSHMKIDEKRSISGCGSDLRAQWSEKVNIN